MKQTTQHELDTMCAKFFPVFQEYLRRHSIGSGDIELASSLDGVYSLPAVFDLGGVNKTVRVPLSLLKHDVDSSVTDCEIAAEEARKAAKEADAAAKLVTDATLDIESQKQAAIEAANEANAAASRTDKARVEMETQLRETDKELKDAELLRKQAETLREQAETARTGEEERRKQAETSRDQAELQRVQAEQNRVTEEQNREAEFVKLKSASESATQKALDAADAADNASANALKLPKIQGTTWHVWDVESQQYLDSEVTAASKSPIIKDGTWWVWDDISGVYRDTGQTVNSDFKLTKEGVESVLTGDIASHTHEHLRQVCVQMDDEPGEQTLEWTDNFGSHTFTPGNMVQVEDSSALPGCRIYMMVGLVSGHAQWAQIPCIPAGYKVVIVKE